MRPIAIDTYCCEGAVSRGLERAGFDVLGVDLFRHRNTKGKLVGYDRGRYPYPPAYAELIGHAARAAMEAAA